MRFLTGAIIKKAIHSINVKLDHLERTTDKGLKKPYAEFNSSMRQVCFEMPRIFHFFCRCLDPTDSILGLGWKLC